jgi:hypothetical protein
MPLHRKDPADQLQPFGLWPSSRARLMSQPQPNALGVNSLRSAGFHQRLLYRAHVGRRQSYGTPRNVPVRDLPISRSVPVRFGPGVGLPDGAEGRYEIGPPPVARQSGDQSVDRYADRSLDRS